MKKNYFVLLYLLILSSSLLAQSPLCSSVGSDQNHEWVTRIKIADGEKTSGKTGYMDFTGSSITTLTAGETYPVEIDVNTDGFVYKEFVKLWLDSNQDNEIQDPAELVYDQNKEFSGFTTFTGSITIPPTAYNGSMIIRMIMQFNSSPNLCGPYTYGTTYDVKVNVLGGEANPNNYSLSVSTTGEGGVVSNPEGINTVEGISSFDFPAGTNVTLTATPVTDFQFSNWTGNGSGTNTSYSFNINEDSNIIANFSSAIPDPVINTQPLNKDICQGDDTSFSIEVSDATTYQWQVSTEDGFVDILNGDTYSGVNSSTLEITGAEKAFDGKLYRCVASNTSGTVTSDSANLSVTHITAKISSKADVSCNGRADGAATVIAEGGTGNYTYLWSNGATTASIANLAVGTYSVEVFGDKGCVAKTTVTINTINDITAPVPNIATLENLNVECEVTNGMIEAPTATDNCAGVLTATTTDPLTYTEPGSYTVVWKYDDGNDNITTQNQNIVVQASPLEAVTFENKTFVYNEKAQNIEVNNLPENAKVTYTIASKNGVVSEAINAGKYTITAKLSLNNTTCSNREITADLVINKAEALITADAVQTFTYDGTIKNLAATLNHSETALSYTPAQGSTDAGTYDVTVSAAETGNYLPASKEISLVIEKAEITGVDFESNTFTYDGTSKSIKVSGLPEGAEVSYENNNQINAGTYEVIATISQENYNDNVLTADLVIKKAESVITADAVQTFTYDGTIKNLAATLNHSETALSYTPAQGSTDAGTYDVTVSAAETGNYLPASKEISLVIEKAEITGVDFESNTFTYDGTSKSIKVSGLPEGAEVSYENNNQINAGTYEVIATISQENYNDNVLTADLVIKKAESVITADAVQTFTYDGTIKNLAATLNHSETALSYTPAQGSTDAGTYDVTVSAAETGNYLPASKEISLVIEKAEITGVDFESNTFTYDGTSKSIKVSGLPEGAEVSYENNNQINAGTYEVIATIGQENYNDNVLTADLVIKKAESVITADAVQTFTYDGTIKNLAATLNHSETALSYAPAQGYTDAGTYDVTVSAAETGNYLPASKEISLVIEKAEIEGVAFEADTFTYDGTSKSISVTGLPEGASVKYENNGKINAGTYEVTATVSQENYNDQVLTADLVINKAEALITANAVQSFTYDGTIKNLAATLNHSETALSYTPAQGYTNGGTYPVIISAAETGNYLPASKEISLVIEKAEIEGVAFEADTFTYDGTSKSISVTGLPEGASVKYENNGKINAGTYEVTATVSQENYNDQVLTADLVINKAEALITANAVQSFTYDGTIKNLAATLNHSETALSYTPAQGYTNGGTYPVIISAAETGNYLPASKEISLVIEKAEIEGVVFEADTFTYDGTSKSISVNGLPEGSSVNYENNNQTEAGTYAVTATVSQENYNDKVLTADLIIEKAEALITANAVQTFTYDGTVQNIGATLNHSETALSYAPAQGSTNAGTYDVTVSAAETGNYLPASKEISLVIENAEITGVDFESNTFTYDGTSKSIAVKGLPEGATVEYVNNGQINAGIYTVTATISQENYNDKILTADLVIKKAESVITADAVQTFTYDGTIKNLAATLNHSETALSYTPAQGSTDAGTYSVTISSEETDNYLLASKEVSLVIENAEITGLDFESNTFTYDGTSKSISVTDLPEGASVKYENNGKINAGTYEVIATIGQENYNDKVLTADLVINKAEALITADAVQTFTYDGTVQNVGATLNHSETALSYTPAQGSTDAGTYSVTISSEETDNYLSASKEVSLVIENAEITGLDFESKTFTYDGTSKSISVTGLPEGASVKYENNGKINAGTYQVTATVNQENYNDQVLTADLVINKTEAIITAETTQTFTYDGTIKNLAATLNHSETALSYAPAQGYTDSGTYDVTVSAAETGNYLPASKEVSLVIENAEITGVDFESNTFTYDGISKSIAVSGLPEGAEVSYENNNQINAGTYEVMATISQENYNDKVLTADLVINKAEALITANAVQSFTYDGTIKNLAATLNHSETALSYAPAQGFTDAGTYPVIISAAETGNYLPASKEVALVIEKAEIEGVTFIDNTFTYNSKTHSLAVTGLPEGTTVDYENNGKVNAGTYEVIATISQENYNEKVLTADLVIKKAESVITADAVQIFTYDGTIKNLAATLNHSETALSYTPAQGFTDAGTYDVTVSAAETGNYLPVSKEISLVIEKAEIEGVAFEADTFTYDGTSKSISVTGLPEGASVKYENNGKINAGTYEVTATISQENYNDNVLTADLVIKKAESVITADAVQTFIYDGTVQNIGATLNHSETALSYAPAQGYTDAGTYPIIISAAETVNYLPASREVSLVIENAEITGVDFESNTFTYDGTSKSIAVKGLPEGATVEYVNNGQINAGIYTVTATVSQKNYNDKVLTADLVITKAEALITADGVQTFTYDGTIKNVGATLNHSETALSYTPAQGYTNGGTYPVIISAAETGNYLPASKEISLVIEKAEIEGVTFKGNIDPFTYNGNEHSIFVNGLPEGAAVEYNNNGKINAGTYKVTARVKQSGYEDLVLTAHMIIEKASQNITFDEIEDRNQQTNENFQLGANSSSGLPIIYSYTYMSENPAATVSPRGFVRILGGGQIIITATQTGSQNYEAADAVVRTLTVKGSEARLVEAVINGITYSHPSEDIYYLIGCGNSENEVKIELAQNQGSSIDQDNSFTLNTPTPGIYRETVTVTSEDGNSSHTYNIIVEKNFNFEDIVVQKFNNVLLVNNNPETNGGYKFVSYRWYRDGSVIGNSQYYSAGNNADNQLDADNSYYVVLETEDGEILRTCTSAIQLRSSLNVALAPNPVSSGGTMELFADFPKDELETMKLSIHNLNGMLIKQMKSNSKSTSIALPYHIEMGVYILKIETKNIRKSLKFIIK